MKRAFLAHGIGTVLFVFLLITLLYKYLDYADQPDFSTALSWFFPLAGLLFLLSFLPAYYLNRYMLQHNYVSLYHYLVAGIGVGLALNILYIFVNMLQGQPLLTGGLYENILGVFYTALPYAFGYWYVFGRNHRSA